MTILERTLRRMAAGHLEAMKAHEKLKDEARFAPEQDIEDVFIQMHREIRAILLDQANRLR